MLLNNTTLAILLADSLIEPDRAQSFRLQISSSTASDFDVTLYPSPISHLVSRRPRKAESPADILSLYLSKHS